MAQRTGNALYSSLYKMTFPFPRSLNPFTNLQEALEINMLSRYQSKKDKKSVRWSRTCGTLYIIQLVKCIFTLTGHRVPQKSYTQSTGYSVGIMTTAFHFSYDNENVLQLEIILQKKLYTRAIFT